MDSRSGHSPARTLGLVGVLGLGLIASGPLVLHEGPPKHPSNDFAVLRVPNNIAHDAHIAEERRFVAENRIRVDCTGKQLHVSLDAAFALARDPRRIWADRARRSQPEDVFTNAYNPYVFQASAALVR